MVLTLLLRYKPANTILSANFVLLLSIVFKYQQLMFYYQIFGNETTYFIHSFEEGLAAAMNLNNMSMTYYEQNGEGLV